MKTAFGSAFASLLFIVGCLCMVLLYSSADHKEQFEPAYIILRALSKAYPEQISKFSFRSRQNDWGIMVNGTWFNWAHGRLLPDNLVADYKKYRSLGVYYYPKDLPPVPPFDTEEEKKFLAELRHNKDGLVIKGSNAFNQALFQAPNKQAMDKQIQEIPFMEFRIKVHPMIIWPLKRVERRLLLARRQSREMEQFFTSLRNISTYSWRRIQYFETLSNHSFGTALDFLPRSWNGKAAYWNWERDLRENWYNIPYKERWSPPQQLIDIFEAEGFIWGGKWLYFDPMHFEYRPELFLLRDYLAQHRDWKSRVDDE